MTDWYSPSMLISRRDFITRSFCLGATTALVGTSAVGSDTTENLELIEVNIPLSNLPKDLIGYRIGLLTDIHLGVAISTDFVADAISAVVAHQVDLLLFGGDYLWIAESRLGKLLQPERSPQFARLHSDQKRAEAIFQTLTRMIPHQPPRDGIFWVFGNHDRWLHPEMCATSWATTSARGLLNEQVEITRGTSSLLLVGADDYLTGVPLIPPLRRDRPGPTLLLTHNPDHAAELSARNQLPLFDLVLCGHTHGGQVCLPLIGAPLYNVRHRRFGSGLLRENSTWVYTSRGIGVVEFPYRIACRPEATIITLIQQA